MGIADSFEKPAGPIPAGFFFLTEDGQRTLTSVRPIRLISRSYACIHPEEWSEYLAAIKAGGDADGEDPFADRHRWSGGPLDLMAVASNFDFLASQDERFARLGALAERHFFEDAPSALIKLRQLAEFIAKEVAARHGLLPTSSVSFDEVLRTLKLKSILPREVGELFFHLKRVGNAAVHEDAGTPNKLYLPVPPLSEQRRIVAKLDGLAVRLTRARAELERISSLADRLRTASLSQAISEQTRPLVKLGDLLDDLRAGKNLKCDERPPVGNERGVVKVSAVSAEVFRPSESKTLPRQYVPPSRDLIMKGDLLIARASGSLNLVGRVALVEEAPENLYLSDKVLRIIVRDDLTQWVYWSLRSPFGRRQIEDAASGISMHNITQPSLRSILIPLPSEGRRRKGLKVIQSAFARADRLEAEAVRALALLDRLESAILAKAFRGKLVPQDPNDEPASALLERIRAQRAASPKRKRNRRAH